MVAYAEIKSAGAKGRVGLFEATMEGMQAYFSVAPDRSSIIAGIAGPQNFREATDELISVSESFFQKISGFGRARIAEADMPPLEWQIYREKPYVLRARRLREQGEDVPRYFVIHGGGEDSFTRYRVGDTRKLYRPMIDVYHIEGRNLLVGPKKHGSEITNDLRFEGGFRVARSVDRWVRLLESVAVGAQVFRRQPSIIPREWWRKARS